MRQQKLDRPIFYITSPLILRVLELQDQFVVELLHFLAEAKKSITSLTTIFHFPNLY